MITSNNYNKIIYLPIITKDNNVSNNTGKNPVEHVLRIIKGKVRSSLAFIRRLIGELAK